MDDISDIEVRAIALGIAAEARLPADTTTDIVTSADTFYDFLIGAK